MAVSSNQKVGELAMIAYLALLHAESELGEETNTLTETNLQINYERSVWKYWNCLVTQRAKCI